MWHASKFTRDVLKGLLGIGFEHPQQIIWDKPSLAGGFVGMAIYGVYSARTEGLMTQAFLEQCTRYKRRTEAFMPFAI